MRELRPSAEYRTPTEQEWDEFLGHFERRRLAIGTCGRPYTTPCIHEHACLRCSLLRPDPTQRARLIEIRDNLIAEARQQAISSSSATLCGSYLATDQGGDQAGRC